MATRKRRRVTAVLKAPKRIEEDYYKHLARIPRVIELYCRQEITPLLEGFIERGHNELRGDRMDTVQGDIDRIFSRLEGLTQEMFGTSWKNLISVEAAEATNAFNADANARAVKQVLMIDVVAAEPWLQPRIEQFVSTNADLITSLTDDSIRKIKLSLQDVIEQGMRNEDFAKVIEQKFGAELQRVTGNTRSRAKLIARDQISKFNGKLTEVRQTSLGFTSYVWSTSGDERVRESHRSKNGKVFKWADPPADTGHPTVDINCRCEALPHLTPDMESDVNLRRLFNR